MKVLMALVVLVAAACSADALRCVRCHSQYVKPVCGHDGRTYANECVLRTHACETRQAIVAVRDGPCPAEDGKYCDIDCTEATEKLMCGSDGEFYTSECEMKQASCDLREPITFVRGAIPGDNCREYHGFCSRLVHPVCANNGQTYTNECWMRYDSWKTATPLIKVYSGKCY